MTWFAKPFFALGFGAFFLCAATCAHFDELAMPWSLVPDWAAGLVLIGGAVISQREWVTGRQYQIAAWAFMVSLLFGSFVGNVEEWASPTTDAAATATDGLVSLSQGPYIVIIGLLLALALAGLTTTLGTKTARPLQDAD